MSPSSEPLSLDVEPLRGSPLPLRLTFRNRSDGPVRLPDLFGEESAAAVLLVNVVDEAGDLVAPAFGGAKADPFAGSMRYVEIEPGGSWSVTVPLTDLDPSILDPGGAYRLEATYRSQHGEEGFTGTLSASAPLPASVDGPAEP